MTSWKKEALELRLQEATPPPGCQSIEDIARELEVTEKTALDIVKRLIKNGRAERVQGKQLSSTGALIQCFYYRLVGNHKPAAKAKK